MKKQNRVFSKLYTLLFVLAGALIMTSCDNGEDYGDGKFVLNVTDAPIDDENVSGVFITFTGIEYQIDGEAWQTAEGFGDPQTINLLELQNGKTSLLGEFNAGAGNYTGLRFQLDATERDGAVSSNPGCYITYNDGTADEPLFVPSGEQTGYKAVGNFTVPVNGTVEVTADFDLRKSVVEAGASGMFLLKPTIRIIVNGQAGAIEGTISNTTEGNTYAVYAYEAGTYTDSESADPADGEARFPNAVTSTGAEADGSYKLAFLAEGNYDVILTSVDADGNVAVISQEEGISVESNVTTTLNLVIQL